MAGIVKKLLNISVVALTIPMMSYAAQKDNPRASAVNRNGASVSQESDSNAATRDSATGVIARSVSANARQKRSAVGSRPVATSATQNRAATSSVANRSRSATPRNTASTTTNKNTRVNTARATAVFNDVTKIGGGYTNCRDAYATCMDQICANANDTYRRCFCSDKFISFRDTSNKIDSALTLLAQFQDNNLEAVDKTAAEVNAMYTASEGESKIKKDTSASQKLLNNVTNLLAGKTIEKKQTNLNSLGVLDLSGFNTDTDDIWGGTSSIFGGDSYQDLADLEGKELFNRAHAQCAEIVRDSCSGEAIYNLARSAYSIMITQDCNVYEKSINAKRASLEETVRTAQKYLREARLEEYRAHNSADVLQCLSNVETAMRDPVACGENYERCMDYTGRYINTTTGEPIFSNKLFGLNSLIILDGSSDVLKSNSDYDKWLDKNMKQFASTALDSCRDISETVWREFKRSALIQIAQAQDEKIQQVKDTCVETIKECYDENTETLNDIDTTKMQSAGGLAALAARGTCYDKVIACAALYGDPDGCKYDDKTKKITNSGGKKCGLQSLLTYVDTVDAVKVAEGCETALRKYAHELCDPKTSDATAEYPAGCATMSRATLRAKMERRKEVFCPVDGVMDDESNILSVADAKAFNTSIMEQVIQDIYDELELVYIAGCEDDTAINGQWVSSPVPEADKLSAEYYKKYRGLTSVGNYNETQVKALSEKDGDDYVGWCVMSNAQYQCSTINNATWENGSCVLPNYWYYQHCTALDPDATWNGIAGTCTIGSSTYTLDIVP